MDVKRYINTRIWSDTWFEELEGIERLVWLYLLTNQQTNLIGIYEIGIRRISNESGVEINRLQTVMERFQNDSKAFHNGRFVIIPNYLKNQNLANPNMVISAKNLFDSLPDDVKNLLQSLGIADFEKLREGLSNRLKTVTQPFANPSIREREIESEDEREGEAQNSDFAKSPIGSRPLGILEEVRMFSPDGFAQPKSDHLPEPEEKKKVAPKKKNATQMEMMEEVVLPFDSAEFKETWINWLKYRSICKIPYKAPETMQMALNKLSKFPQEAVILAINDSIANQWQGLFPEKYTQNANFNRNTRQEAREPQPGRRFGKL